jgi:hypothetical protein
MYVGWSSLWTGLSTALAMGADDQPEHECHPEEGNGDFHRSPDEYISPQSGTDE